MGPGGWGRRGKGGWRGDGRGRASADNAGAVGGRSPGVAVGGRSPGVAGWKARLAVCGGRTARSQGSWRGWCRRQEVLASWTRAVVLESGWILGTVCRQSHPDPPTDGMRHGRESPGRRALLRLSRVLTLLSGWSASLSLSFVIWKMGQLDG